MATLFEKIENLREHASELKRLKDGHLDNKAADKLRVVEDEIDSLLMRYINLPPCPYCTGKLIERPTRGVLHCDRCQAIVLRGRV